MQRPASAPPWLLGRLTLASQGIPHHHSSTNNPVDQRLTGAHAGKATEEQQSCEAVLQPPADIDRQLDFYGSHDHPCALRVMNRSE